MTPSLSTLSVQTGKLGKPFRNISVQRVGTVPSKWVSGGYVSHWLHVFRYEDDRSLFGLHLGYSGEVVRKLNDKEVKELMK